MIGDRIDEESIEQFQHRRIMELFAERDDALRRLADREAQIGRLQGALSSLDYWWATSNHRELWLAVDAALHKTVRRGDLDPIAPETAPEGGDA